MNPDAPAIARALDRERKQGSVRGPLHGIPIVIKENIDTDDAMLTTAGSLALVDSSSGSDATVAARLRDAGAVIIGKANLSEWANFRSFQSSSGWSARGGQMPQPLCPRPQPVRFELGVGCRRFRQPGGGVIGHRDRRVHRVPGHHQRGGRASSPPSG